MIIRTEDSFSSFQWYKMTRGPGWRTPSIIDSSSGHGLFSELPCQINHLLEHGVGGSYNPGIGLESTLCSDDIGEFLG